MNRLFLVVAGVVLPCHVAAQVQSPVAVPAPSSVEALVNGSTLPASTLPADACAEIPALTPIVLEIGIPVGSKISKTGERFPLALKQAIVIEGKEVVAAGTTGEGEIVHAKKAGGSGAAGELVLAARKLMVGDRILPLRSMRVNVAARDSIAAVDTLNAAAAGSGTPIGLLGFAITGKNIEMPAGTLANAKTATVFALDPACRAATETAAPPPSAGATNSPTNGGE